MFCRFFVPLDGSLRAEKAIPVAAEFARNAAGTVILARLVVPPFSRGYDASIADEVHLPHERGHSEASIYLDEVRERYNQVLTGLHVIVEVVPSTDTLSSSILALAQQEHSDLIVLASHGDNWLKRWIFGSVAQNTMRHSPLPILVLNDHGHSSMLENPVRPLRVLAAMDGSAFSEAVLQPLCQMLAMFPTEQPHELHLLQVIALPPAIGGYYSGAYVNEQLQQDEQKRGEQYLQSIAPRIAGWMAGKTNVTVTTRSLISLDVATTVLERAQETKCDLIAVATHGRTGLKRAFLGSVTERILGTTTLPLFVVCPPAMKAEREDILHQTSEKQETQVEQGFVGLL